MDGRETEGETASRFVNLLQPSRDLAANWAVDVSKELESYLAELSLTGLLDDEQSSLNFAEAALLIQGSIQVYSKKVEYLYALVLQALNFLSQKKQGQQEKSSLPAEGRDADDQQEEFLNLDDLPEETNIDFHEQENGVFYATSAAKIPASLLIVEGDGADLSGDSGELGTYQIATCTLHRNFLLLDPGDADSLDIYLRQRGNAEDEGTTPFIPPSSVPRTRTPRGNKSTGGKRPCSALRSGNVGGTPVNFASSVRNLHFGGPDECDDAWQADDVDDGGTCVVDPWARDDDQGTNDEPVRSSDKTAESHKDDYIDPWIPLNPHEPGTLPIQPYKRGKTQRKVHKKKKVKDYPQLPAASRTGVCYPEFAKALQAREHVQRAERQADGPNFFPLFEHLRSSFRNSNTELPEYIPKNIHHDMGLEDPDVDDQNGACYDAGTLPTFDEAFGSVDRAFEPPEPGHRDNDNFYGSEDGPTFQHETDGMSLEELCSVHMDEMLQKLAQARVQTGLAARVSSWKQKVEATLLEQDSHPPFDIHEYGDQLLSSLRTSIGEEGTFSELVHGQQKNEVARSFSALLQLVNNGNVSIEKWGISNACHCFTAERPFIVKLLSSQGRHEEMLRNMGFSRAQTTFKSVKRSNMQRGLDIENEGGPNTPLKLAPDCNLKRPSKRKTLLPIQV